MFTVVQRPSPNFYTGRNGHKVQAIVDHIAADSGNVESSIGWLTNPKSQVSAHFIVGQDGSITQMVATENAAWANGILEDGADQSVPFIKECVETNENPNYYTISIEHSGNSGVPLTEAQYQASLWLHKQLIRKFGISVDNTHIIGHNRISPQSRRYCPGVAYPFDRLYQDLNTSSTPQHIMSNKFVIGPGAQAVLDAHGDTPTTDETYAHENISANGATTTVSFTYFTNQSTGQNGVVVWDSATGKTHRYIVAD